MVTTISLPRFDYDIDPIYLNEDMSNKLFCTFATEDTIDSVLKEVQERYKIIYNKIFVLYAKSQDEYICTYNVDFGNVGTFLDNTILVHRKKQSNSIYTINALNEVVKSKTGGMLDNSYMIDWEEFRNCILTTSNTGYKMIPTKVFKSFNTQNLEN